jgi:hypothetical protein
MPPTSPDTDALLQQISHGHDSARGPLLGRRRGRLDRRLAAKNGLMEGAAGESNG